MLENRVTGLFLLSDLSVGCTTDLIQDSAPFALFFSVSKANLDRCAFAKEGYSRFHKRRREKRRHQLFLRRTRVFGGVHGQGTAL